jgi:hypothetical protein
MLRKSLQALAPACLIVVACVCVAAAAENLPPTAAAGSTTNDIAQLIMAAAATALPVLASFFYAQFCRVVKDKDMRARALAALQAAGPLTINALDGLLKDHPVPADRVPESVLSLIRFAKQLDPDAFEHAQFGAQQLVHYGIAHLPGVAGEVSDADVAALSAIAGGHMPIAGGNDDLVKRLDAIAHALGVRSSTDAARQAPAG